MLPVNYKKYNVTKYAQSMLKIYKNQVLQTDRDCDVVGTLLILDLVVLDRWTRILVCSVARVLPILRVFSPYMAVKL